MKKYNDFDLPSASYATSDSRGPHLPLTGVGDKAATGLDPGAAVVWSYSLRKASNGGIDVARAARSKNGAKLEARPPPIGGTLPLRARSAEPGIELDG